MRLQIAPLIGILAIGALATYPVSGSEYGLDSDLKAVPLVPGARVAGNVIDNCVEKSEVDGQVINGEECFAHALQYMIEVLSEAHNFNQFVALLSNNVSGVQSIAAGPADPTATSSSSSLDSASSAAKSRPAKTKRDDDDALGAVLSELNDQIRRRSEGKHRPRAVQIEHSEIHPTDGLAIRTNVQSGDATLHVHTNGSHATAAFKKDAFPPLGRRDDSWASGSRFRFDGLQGLKLELKAEEQQGYGILSTLLLKLAYGEQRMAPKLKESDSWALALCRRSDKVRTLQGKLVAEDNGAGYDWEDVTIDCAA
jgi:hypothetical protein